MPSVLWVEIKVKVQVFIYVYVCLGITGLNFLLHHYCDLFRSMLVKYLVVITLTSCNSHVPLLRFRACKHSFVYALLFYLGAHQTASVELS